MSRTLPSSLGRAVLLAGLLVSGSEAADRLPDIVVITLDTTRSDRLGCYGYFRDTTPHLDAFAREALLFENALTHMSTTLPAHVSLFTSTHTIRHGVRGNLVTFHVPYDENVEFPIAARLFSEIGYTTAGFVSCSPLKEVTGIATGFDTYREPEEIQLRGEETTTAAIEWLESDPGQPIFLWVHYFDPHDMYSAPPPYRRFFSTDEPLLEYLRENAFVNWDRLDIQHFTNMYDGEMRYMDAEIGRLFDVLRERGLWDEAAIVIVGDHGEGLGQHDFIRHGSLNQEQLRVPLLVKLPASSGVEPARRARRTAVVDVLPTLVEELALPIPADVQARFEGRNMLRDPEWEYVFAERAHGREEKFGPGAQYTLTGRDWKYFHSTHEPDQLFDLRVDPLEIENVIDRHPEVASRLEAKVRSWLEEAGVDESVGTQPAVMDSLSAERLEELRALGYVD